MMFRFKRELFEHYGFRIYLFALPLLLVPLCCLILLMIVAISNVIVHH
jgi:hypothetical protein